MDMNGDGSTKSMLTISDRLMGMRAAILADNPSLKSFGSKLGFFVLQLNELVNSYYPSAGSAVDVVALELLKLLGFQEGKTVETKQFDLVFLHVGAGEETDGQKNLEYVNALVGGVMQIAQTGSKIGSCLYLSLVSSYGHVPQDDNSSLSVSMIDHKANSDLSLLFPCQSYSMKGSNVQKDVRTCYPMLVVQWHSALTRKDMVEKFSFQDFKEHCGDTC